MSAACCARPSSRCGGTNERTPGRRPAGARRFRGGPGMTTLVTGIGELVTNDPLAGPGLLGLVTDAAVVVDDGRIAWVGPANAAPAAERSVDLGGRAVLPGFVDGHTHLVFAGDRSAEFQARMSGERYDGGG